MNHQELYMAALATTETATGYYNRNAGLDTPEGRVNVRIPLPGADVMDVRLWREEEVLAAVSPYVDHAPELRHVSREPRFQVQGFIDGRLLDGFSPRGSAVPDHVLDDVVGLLVQLTAIPSGKLPALPDGWPAPGDSTGFGRRLSALTRRIHTDHLAEYGEVFAAFGFPADPLIGTEERWTELTSRPFSALHADLHRKNMIVSGGVTWFLDWELALWGDPAYELAIHLHKMDYPADQREALVARWLRAMPTGCTVGWRRDMAAYLRHERLKSAVVDTVRYSKQLATPGTDPEFGAFLVSRLAKKVNAARRDWGVVSDVTTEDIRAGLRRGPTHGSP
ncbi:phosphotransferase family protein [Streptomyces noursei]|uniref:phosphotransferase family protein n=1 Tax=Streptomyces noursei TaxID=1971 RepID=UPI0023B8117E|nr:aminoglycoside phosphotransferase family protein [Streptomyces noursei]